MPVGLLVIEKRLGSKVWSNTWGIGLSAITDGQITTNAQLELMLDGLQSVPDIEAATNLSSGDYFNASNASSIVAAIIAFERGMHFQAVQFTRAYLSDGKTKNRGVPGPSGVFAALALSGTGLRPNPGEGIAPATTVPDVNRRASLLSHRNGSWFPRATQARGDVVFGTDDGVDWASPGTRATYQSIIDGNAAASRLDAGFGGFFETNFNGCYIAIPRYAPTTSPLPGVVLGGVPCAGLTAGEMISRQAKKGKRRTNP